MHIITKSLGLIAIIFGVFTSRNRASRGLFPLDISLFLAPHALRHHCPPPLASSSPTIKIPVAEEPPLGQRQQKG